MQIEEVADAKQYAWPNGNIRENNYLLGPLKSLGGPGSYPLSPFLSVSLGVALSSIDGLGSSSRLAQLCFTTNVEIFLALSFEAVACDSSGC